MVIPLPACLYHIYACSQNVHVHHIYHRTLVSPGDRNEVHFMQWKVVSYGITFLTFIFSFSIVLFDSILHVLISFHSYFNALLETISWERAPKLGSAGFEVEPFCMFARCFNILNSYPGKTFEKLKVKVYSFAHKNWTKDLPFVWRKVGE